MIPGCFQGRTQLLPRNFTGSSAPLQPALPKRYPPPTFPEAGTDRDPAAPAGTPSSELGCAPAPRAARASLAAAWLSKHAGRNQAPAPGALARGTPLTPRNTPLRGGFPTPGKLTRKLQRKGLRVEKNRLRERFQTNSESPRSMHPQQVAALGTRSQAPYTDTRVKATISWAAGTTGAYLELTQNPALG